MKKFFIFVAFVCATNAFSDLKRAIPNHMRAYFPHELVYMDFAADEADKLKIVRGMGEERPVQVEMIEKNGKKIARAWFIASLYPELDEKGRMTPPSKIEVSFESGSARPGISMKEKDGYFIIENGVHEFKIKKYVGDMGGIAFGKCPHWLGGMRVKGSNKWDGKAFFEGSSKIKSARTEIINQGPVFIDLRITYVFEEDGEKGEKVFTVPLMLGKKSFEYEPNKVPSEEIPKREKYYEAMLRFVAGDPWVEIVERYHLPPDETVENYGIHQYSIYWGETEKLPPEATISVSADEFEKIDTAMNVPWFEYDSFGGNSSLKILPAKPRPAQKGRPFALLRPRWNQGGGGSQEFFLTSGGEVPFNAVVLRKKLEEFRNKNQKEIKNCENEQGKERKNKSPDNAKIEKLENEIESLKAKDAALEEILKNWDTVGIDQINSAIEKIGVSAGIPKIQENPGYSGKNPAFGIVAAYPSKWAGPYPATIAAHANPKRNCARFPLINGYGSKWTQSQPYYGARSYAICVGPRNLFDSIDKMNSLIRRHTDWTLVANINKYVLDWKRDDSAKAPHILVNAEQLEELREEFKSSKSSEIQQVKKEMEDKIQRIASVSKERDALTKEKDSIQKEISEKQEMLKKLDRKKDDAKFKKIESEIKALKNGMDENNKKFNELKEKSKEVENLLKDKKVKFLAFLAEDRPSQVSYNEMPRANTYLDTRYQDDANNPTNYGTRRMVNNPFPYADLFSAGSIFGGAEQAAIGYIFTDLDSWPGWHNGWNPGNPNFHTDKYLASIFAGASMPDHPHAKEWLAFGMSNLEDDIAKVITPPDGAGYECPGYSGYSLGLQLEIIRTIFNCGFKNIPFENPLFKKTATWHRKLITPYDYRIKKRHEAPLGDTHRWDSGLGNGFRLLATYFKEKDPKFASELVGTYNFLVNSGATFKDEGISGILAGVSSTKAVDPDKMDWSSEKFEGFGAILRTNFGTPKESFATLKAGECQGHYHNDELTYHLYLQNSPVSLDYNCSYHPRGDHAVLHNSLTFGKEGKVKNNATGQDVPAMEQSFGTGKIIEFLSTDQADIVVAEKSSDSLSMSPIYPEDAEFGREYPTRKTSKMWHRRWLALVKHPNNSKINDYLVVLDETKSEEPRTLNIHLLSRETEQNGNLFKATGQYDKDFRLFIASEPDPKCEIRGWGYFDEYMDSPGKEYELKPGETQKDYVARMKEIDPKSLPKKGWKPKWEKNPDWQKLAKETKWQSLIPPPNWKESWMYGEYQQWLRIFPEQDKAILWVLCAFDREKEKEPHFESISSGKGFKISADGESEEIIIDATGQRGQFVIIRNGKEEVLIPAGKVAELK